VGNLPGFNERRSTMSYVDGFVVPVPAGNKEAYLKSSRKMTTICKRYGATRMVECWGDDVPDGKTTDFKRAVKGEGGCVPIIDKNV
jgi:uncharacterized protein YbaA (DUF1428 family)